MTENICIKVADIPINLILDKEYALTIKEKYRPFICNSDAEYILYINFSGKSPENQVGDTCISFRNNTLTVKLEETDGRMNLQSKKGEVNICGQYPLAALAGFLKSIYSAIVLSASGLVLHASGVVKNNLAYIFFAPAEGGKTTVTKLSEGLPVLNDETIMIRGLQAFGTPYSGSDREIADRITAGPFRIAGFFKLVKDTGVHLRRLSPSNAAAELFTTSRLYDTITSTQRILNTFSELARSVPCYELHFLKDNSFWKAIENVNRKKVT